MTPLSLDAHCTWQLLQSQDMSVTLVAVSVAGGRKNTELYTKAHRSVFLTNETN